MRVSRRTAATEQAASPSVTAATTLLRHYSVSCTWEYGPRFAQVDIATKILSITTPAEPSSISAYWLVPRHLKTDRNIDWVRALRLDRLMRSYISERW